MSKKHSLSASSGFLAGMGLFLLTACGSSGEGSTDDLNTGTGGSVDTGVGGASVSASGGAAVGRGGAAVGQGGVVVGQGGAAVGRGGAAVGQGGVVVGQGGAAVGRGGAAVGQGGAVVGQGGAVVGQGGAIVTEGGADGVGGAIVTEGGADGVGGAIVTEGGADGVGGAIVGEGGADGVGGDPGIGGSTGVGGSTGEVPACFAKVEGFGEDVTGGLGGNVVTATTGTEIHKAICDRAADDTPLTIMVNGTITPGNTLKQSGSCSTADGVIELKEISNISLIGVGTSGVLDQIGVHIRGSSNIIVQNLTIKNVRKSNTDTPSNGGDAIGMESDVHNIWIDHNLIFGSTTEGEEHDGLIDMKANTTDVTVSFNHIHTGGRGGLVCSNDDGTDGSTRITWHHNWYQNLTSRTHLVREALGHAYNNYYSQILETGINSRNGAQLLVEGNYFTESRNPLGTFFYLENPGVWQVKDNFFDTSVVWETAEDQVAAGPDVQSTGSVSVPYSYTLHEAGVVPAMAMACVGVGKL